MPKISELPAVETLTGAEQLPCVQDELTKKLTPAQFQSFMRFKSIGWCDYDDDSTASSPLSVTADTWTDLPNDGAGVNTQLDYLPAGVTTLFNTDTGKFDFSELSIGDLVVCRVDLLVTTTTLNVETQLRWSAGEGGSPFTVPFSGPSNHKVAETFPIGGLNFIYIGSASARDNPAALQILASANCTVQVRGFAALIVRLAQ